MAVHQILSDDTRLTCTIIQVKQCKLLPAVEDSSLECCTIISIPEYPCGKVFFFNLKVT